NNNTESLILTKGTKSYRDFKEPLKYEAIGPNDGVGKYVYLSFRQIRSTQSCRGSHSAGIFPTRAAPCGEISPFDHFPFRHSHGGMGSGSAPSSLHFSAAARPHT